MAAGTPLARELFTRLSAALDHDGAHRALASVGAESALGAGAPHALRAALAALTDDSSAARALRWPVLQAAREALDAADGAIDRALHAALLRDPAGAVCRELAACADDGARLDRSLDLAWRHHSPPAGRAAAALIDVARALPDPTQRGAVYAFLVERGVDVRGPLADDALLPPARRLGVLCSLAARQADRGALRSPDATGDPSAALCRALSDWTRFATHPRQLLYLFRSRDPNAFGAVLSKLAARPLPPEVFAEVSLERNGAPREVRARALGAGRYECGRCGHRTLMATGHRALDPADPEAGGEIAFACGACRLRYFASWERESLDATHAPVPVAWLPD